MNEWRPHSVKQDQAVRSIKPIVALGTGIQFGKTTVGAVKAKVAIHTFVDPSDNFLIVAPTYKILSQSTIPAFLKVMEGCGDFSKADMVFKTHWGSTVYFRTGENADSIVGITNVRFVWADEAGLLTLYFWENIQARAAFKEAQIVLTTSPYTLNWMYKEIIRPCLKGDGPNHVELIQAASWENPFMPASVIERARLTMDPRRFNALFGGQWERMSGLVYDVFDEEENQCDPFVLPAGTRFVGGIDWGWTEPFVFKVRGITPDNFHFGVDEVYKSALTLTDISQIVLRLSIAHGVKMIYAGPDQPGNIEELNRNFRALNPKGPPPCVVVPANNDVRVGVDRHYELLKTRRLKYFRGKNKHTLDEMDTYHYPSPEELKPDQNAKDAKPVQQHDHAMDAERYISIMTYTGAQVGRVFVPQDQDRPRPVDHHKETERLKRPRASGSTEDWS